MQNDFESWDSGSGFENSDTQQNQNLLPGRGGWHWLQTIVALSTVGLLSMICVYLTRNVEERPVWMMGLIFMVPTAALMAATILVERITSAMTPVSSRRPQIVLAVTATVSTFVVACICDLIYLYSFKSPLPPTGMTLSEYQESERLLLIVDRTESMLQNDSAVKSKDTVSTLLDRSESNWEIGIIYGDDIIEPAPLSEKQKQSLLKIVDKKPDKGRMYYRDFISKALDIVEKNSTDIRTRIVLLTDGLHTWSRSEENDLSNRCLKDNVMVSCVQTGSSMIDPVLTALIRMTGGLCLSSSNASQLLDGMQVTHYHSEITPAPVEEKLKLDLLRNRESAAILISCIMLILEGLSLGICISLMLSVHGQFRLQFILSPIMGALAFALLKFIWNNDDIATTWWIKEGMAFSLLGIVLMKRNRSRGLARSSAVNSANLLDNNMDF